MTTRYEIKRRESPFQSKVIKAGKAHGWLVVKVVCESENGWPDLECIRGGRTVRIETKRPDQKGELHPNQIRRHKDIRGHGGEVYVVDSLEQAIDIFKSTGPLIQV